MTSVKLVLLHLAFYDLKRGQHNLLESILYCWLLLAWTRIESKSFICKEYSIYHIEVYRSSLLIFVIKQRKMTTMTSNLAPPKIQSNINLRETAGGGPSAASANSL